MMTINRPCHFGDRLKDLEACRELSYEFLLTETAATERDSSSADAADRPYMPMVVAAINALPWLALAAMAQVLVKHLL